MVGKRIERVSKERKTFARIREKQEFLREAKGRARKREPVQLL